MVRDVLGQQVPMAMAKISLLEKQMALMKLALEQWHTMPYGVPDEHRLHYT